jgi:WW domain-containing oxidoreductase
VKIYRMNLFDRLRLWASLCFCKVNPSNLLSLFLQMMAGTVLITGANGTLALEFVRTLLTLHPQYTILATVRNTSPQKDPNTAELMQLVEKHPATKVVVQQLDLARLDNVRSFAENLSREIDLGNLPRISAIVCNAFTWSLEAGQKLTPDKLEATFQVGHLSHYLLVLKLLGSMNMASGRVVMLGSPVHYPEKPNPLSAFRPGFPTDMEQLVRPPTDRSGEAHDKGYQRYGTAKLSNVTFMHDLNRRLQNVREIPRVIEQER